MDEKIKVTAEKYSEVLYSFLHMYTDKDAVKTMAKYIGYKMSFFDSERKLKFFEELIFAYTALICYFSQLNLMGNDSYSSIRDSFVEKVVARYGKDLSHLSEKLKEYSSAVSEDERQPEVSRLFIASLPPGGVRRALQSASLASVSFGKFCSTLKEALAKHQVVSAP